MERDWYTRSMMKLATAFDDRETPFLTNVDAVLDDISMGLGRHQQEGILSGLGVRRALNILSDLRGRLESARNAGDVRQAFHDCERLREIVDEAREAAAE